MDVSSLASVVGRVAHFEGSDSQLVIDVAVVAQHIAGRDAIFDDSVGIGDQHAWIIHSDHSGSGRRRIDCKVFVVTASRFGDRDADGQVLAISQVGRRIGSDRAGGFTGLNGDGQVVGQFDHNVGLRRVGHRCGVDDLATFIHRRGRGQGDGGGVDGVSDLRDCWRRVGGDDQVAAAGGPGDGGGDRRGVQVRRVITGESDVQHARGLARGDHNGEAVGQGDGQVAGRCLGDEYGVNDYATGFGDARRGGQGNGDVARIYAVVVGTGLGRAYGVTGIQAGRWVTNGGVNHACCGFQHNKTVTATRSAVCACGGRAGSGGFEVLGRVSAGSDGLLQFGNGRCSLSSRSTEVGDRVRSVRAPLSVATQVDDAAVGQFQRHGTRSTGIDLLPCKQAIPFYKQAANPFRGNCEHLTDNAFDDRNAAHKRLSVYYRQGVSIKVTGRLMGADSIAGVRSF
ncbi:hypothetical protein BW43_01032 [Pseudomonas sp. RIT357]|nr:hypothetical protein BW43_01032 [Pseudomonas sp. RIT357]